jgi:hypothetical protein
LAGEEPAHTHGRRRTGRKIHATPLPRHRQGQTGPSPSPRGPWVGEVDMATATVPCDSLLGVLHGQRPAVLEIDLAGVTVMDRAGICALVPAQRHPQGRMPAADLRPATHRPSSAGGDRAARSLTAPIAHSLPLSTRPRTPCGGWVRRRSCNGAGRLDGCCLTETGDRTPDLTADGDRWGRAAPEDSAVRVGTLVAAPARQPTQLGDASRTEHHRQDGRTDPGD